MKVKNGTMAAEKNPATTTCAAFFLPYTSEMTSVMAKVIGYMNTPAGTTNPRIVTSLKDTMFDTTRAVMNIAARNKKALLKRSFFKPNTSLADLRS